MHLAATVKPPRIRRTWDASKVEASRDSHTTLLSLPQPIRGVLDALRAARALRVQPGRDEKIILEWNAMLSPPRSLRAGTIVLESELKSYCAHWSPRTSHGSCGVPPTSGRTQRPPPAWLANAQIDAFEHTGDDEVALMGQTTITAVSSRHYWNGQLPRNSASPNALSNPPHPERPCHRPLHAS